MIGKCMRTACLLVVVWQGAPAQISRAELTEVREITAVLCGLVEKTRTDLEGEFRALADLVKKYPSSPMGEILVQYMDSLRALAADPMLGSDRVLHLLGLEGLHGLTRAGLCRMAREDASRRGDAEAFDRFSPARWALHEGWWSVGPFGDLARSFHGVPYAPESEAFDAAAVFKGRGGCKVTWRKLPPRPHEHLVHLDLASVKKGGCYYGVLHFRPRRPGPAYLWLTGTASYEVWLNGKKVFDRERAFSDNRSRFFPGVHLEEGVNRLRIKTTDSGGAFFRALFVEARGLPVPVDVASSPAPDAPPAASQPGPVAPFRDAEAVLSEALRAEEQNAGFFALRSYVRHLLGLPSLSLADAKRAHDLAPDAVAYQLMLAWAYTIASHLPRDTQRSRARTLIRGVLKKYPENLKARLWEVEFLVKDDKKEEAIRKLEDCLEEFPDFYKAAVLLHSVCSSLSWEPETTRALETLLKMAPRRTKWIRARADEAKEAGNLPRCLALLEKALERHPLSSDLLSERVSVLRAAGDFTGALRHLETLQRLEPNASTLKRLEAVLRSRLGDHAAASRLLKQMAPCDEDPLETRQDQGDLARITGDTPAAIEAYTVVAKQDPRKHETRRLAARLRGEEANPEFLSWRVDGLKAALDFEMKKEHGAAGTVLVVDHMVARYYPDGSSVWETHQVRRLNDPRGVEAHRELDPGEEDLLVRVIHPDGRILIPARVSGKYTLPGLKPGVFIEHRYRTNHAQSDEDPLESLKFYFRSLDEPYPDSRIVFLMPENHRGRFVWQNFSDPPEVRRQGDLTAYVFWRKNQPKVVREAFMPTAEEIVPWCELAEDVSWSALNRRLRNRMRHAVRGSGEIREAARRIAEKIEGESNLARALYDHVQRVVVRGGRGSPTFSLMKRQGNRLFLFASLLEAADIPMRLALCRSLPPDLDPFPVPLFRTDDYFEQPLIRVMPRDGDPVWVVGGVPRYFPYGRFPEFLGGAPVFLLGDSGGMVEYLPEADVEAFASVKGSGVIRLNEDGTARGEFDLDFPGMVGFELKEYLRSANEDIRSAFIRRFLSRPFPGTTLVDHALPGLKDRGVHLRMRLKIDFPSFIRKRGRGKACPLGLPPSHMKRGYARKKERIHPFVHRNYRVSRWRIVLDPGDHHRFPVRPEGVLVRWAFFTYGLSAAMDGEKLVLERSVVLRPGTLAPGEYERLIEIASRVDDVEARMVGVVKVRGR